MTDNNPGNLRVSNIKWNDSIDNKKRGFVKFKTPLAGARASAKNMNTYIERHNLTTISEIIARWAPNSENDTQKYIQDVVSWTGIPSNESIKGDLTKQAQVLHSIFRKETGKDFPMEFILYAMKAAGMLNI